MKFQALLLCLHCLLPVYLLLPSNTFKIVSCPVERISYLGERASFTCTVKHRYKTGGEKFIWYKVNGSITEKAILHNAVLTIPHVGLDDYGKYICIHVESSAFAYAELLSPKQNGIKVDYYTEPENFYKVHQVGEKVILRCSCNATIHCKTQWEPTYEQKNARVSKEDPGILVIDSFKVEDTGFYYCRSYPAPNYTNVVFVALQEKKEKRDDKIVVKKLLNFDDRNNNDRTGYKRDRQGRLMNGPGIPVNQLHTERHRKKKKQSRKDLPEQDVSGNNQEHMTHEIKGSYGGKGNFEPYPISNGESQFYMGNFEEKRKNEGKGHKKSKKPVMPNLGDDEHDLSEVDILPLPKSNGQRRKMYNAKKGYKAQHRGNGDDLGIDIEMIETSPSPIKSSTLKTIFDVKKQKVPYFPAKGSIGPQISEQSKDGGEPYETKQQEDTNWYGEEFEEKDEDQEVVEEPEQSEEDEGAEDSEEFIDDELEQTTLEKEDKPDLKMIYKEEDAELILDETEVMKDEERFKEEEPEVIEDFLSEETTPSEEIPERGDITTPEEEISEYDGGIIEEDKEAEDKTDDEEEVDELPSIEPDVSRDMWDTKGEAYEKNEEKLDDIPYYPNYMKESYERKYSVPETYAQKSLYADKSITPAFDDIPYYPNYLNLSKEEKNVIDTYI